MSNTIEDDAVDVRYLVSSLPGRSESSPTNAASSVKDVKKKANRIAQLKCRQKKHWEREIKKTEWKSAVQSSGGLCLCYPGQFGNKYE
jgi:hypothetical protein